MLRSVRRVGRCTYRHPIRPLYRGIAVASGSAPTPLKLLHIENFAMAPSKDRRFPLGNKGLVGQLLRSEYSEKEIQWEAATLAPPEVLKTVHESSLVDRFLEGAQYPCRSCGISKWDRHADRARTKERKYAVVCRIGEAPKSSRGCSMEGSAACALVRATWLNSTNAIGQDPNGIVGVVGGGLHHAKRAKPNGWCALNDLAIAVQYGLNEHGVKRALVVDLDVHQGDGTAEIFKSDSRVITFSMHARKNFPFVKEQSTHDIELEESVTDTEYLRLLQQWLEYLLRIHKPELIVYQSGVDPLKGDKLGKLSLSRECLRTRTEMLLDLIMAHSPLSKLVITLGGGYQELSVQAHADVFRATADWWKQKHTATFTASTVSDNSHAPSVQV